MTPLDIFNGGDLTGQAITTKNLNGGDLTGQAITTKNLNGDNLTGQAITTKNLNGDNLTGQAITTKNFYFVYVLLSDKDGNFYVGYTCDLENRMGEHSRGEVRSTSYRRPFRLIYFEGCVDKKDAIFREKYLKSSWGKRYIKNRNKNYCGGER
jgi:putative endonuclease